MLASLHHAGWLDTAAALLALHDREADAFALAAGLIAWLLWPDAKHKGAAALGFFIGLPQSGQAMRIIAVDSEGSKVKKSRRNRRWL